jgi:hypothetical protein
VLSTTLGCHRTRDDGILLLLTLGMSASVHARTPDARASTNAPHILWRWVDQVRIWRVQRRQEDIIKWMRRPTGLENHRCSAEGACVAPVGTPSAACRSIQRVTTSSRAYLGALTPASKCEGAACAPL